MSRPFLHWRILICAPILFASAADAETTVRPAQIKNWGQVAIAPPGSNGTQLVLSQLHFPPDWTDVSTACAPFWGLACLTPSVLQSASISRDCVTYPLWIWTDAGRPQCLGLSFQSYPPAPGSRSFDLYSAFADDSTVSVVCTGSEQVLDSFTVPAMVGYPSNPLGTLQIGDKITVRARFAKTGATDFAYFGIRFGGALTPSCCFPTTGQSDTTYYEDLAYTVESAALEKVSGTIYAQNGVTVSAEQSPNTLGTDGSVAIGAPFDITAVQTCTAPDSGTMFSWSIGVYR